MIRENILRIKQRISCICSKINQDPNKITIVAVSKGRSPEQIKEAIAAGIMDIGENRVQEALSKYSDMQHATCNMRLRLHMVGHLQTNKVREAVKIFDLIQSVDSIRLAQEINKQAARMNKVQDILIQVNTSGETSKFGLKPDETIKVINEIVKLKNINIKGLMAIAPLVANPEEARPYFRQLRELLKNLSSILNTQYSILSMGMTDDFEVAIEEGANMIRLGRAIFDL